MPPVGDRARNRLLQRRCRIRGGRMMHLSASPTGGMTRHVREPQPHHRPSHSQEGRACSSSSSHLQHLDAATAAGLVSKLQTFIFDCDGVLWRGNQVVQGSVEALQHLRARGKRLLFVTNNSSKSRAEYVNKFQQLGLAVAADEIVASSYGAAAYLRSIGFGTPQLQPGKRALAFGSAGLMQELSLAGIPVLPGHELQLSALSDPAAMLATQLDESIGAVVLGWDPTFDFRKLQYAAMALRELPGCLLVATNTDDRDLIGDTRIMVGTGALVAALEAGSGARAVNVGKGGRWLFPYLVRCYGLLPQQTCIVGDRLDTDIALGKEGGLVTLLPLTGVTSWQDLEAAAAASGAGVLPDYVMSSVAVLGPPPAPAQSTK